MAECHGILRDGLLCMLIRKSCISILTLIASTILLPDLPLLPQGALAGNSPTDSSDRSTSQRVQETQSMSSLETTLEEVQKQMAGGSQESLPAIDEQTIASQPGLFSIIFRLVAALLFTLLVLAVGVYLVKRFLNIRAPGTSRFMHVISRMSLSPRCTLHLVRVSGRRLLLGEGPQGIRFIADLTEDSEQGAHKDTSDEAPSSVTPADFRKHLQGEMMEVRSGIFSERLQNVVRTCRDYVGKFRQGASDDV